MNFRARIFRLALICLVFAIAQFTPLDLLACPNCKEALASDTAGGGDVVSGFFWSILFMMSMPFAILGTFSSYMYYEVRKARAAQANDVEADTANSTIADVADHSTDSL